MTSSATVAPMTSSIVVMPEAERGRKSDLERFYRNLGFVRNRGRNMDYTLSSPLAGTMYWRPEAT